MKANFLGLALCVLVSPFCMDLAHAGMSSKSGMSKVKVTLKCPTSGLSGVSLLVSIPSGFESAFPTGNTGTAEFDSSNVTAKVMGGHLVCSYPGLTIGFSGIQSVATATSDGQISCPTLSNTSAKMTSSFSPGSGWSTSNFQPSYESSASTVTGGAGKRTGCMYKQSTHSTSLYRKVSGTCAVAADKKSFECSK